MELGRVDLLNALKTFTEAATADLLLPVRAQRVGDENDERPPAVYLMRLPDSKSATKKAPYILHQVVTGQDVQPERSPMTSSCLVRTIICVYSEDEQEGGLMLLEVAERLRIALLKAGLIGDRGQFWLNTQEGVDFLAYPNDTAPYYIGEMATTWHMPAVDREVRYIYEANSNFLRVPRPQHPGSCAERHDL